MSMSKKTSKQMLMQAVDVILPPRCPVTGDIVDAQGMVSAGAWAGLQFVADPICVACGIPFDFDDDETSGHGKCLLCLENEPPFKHARAPLIYNDTSRDLILGFKHGDKTHVVQSFTPWLTRSGAQMLKEADYLIPVPLHRIRLLMRRYNQAALIAGVLSKATDIAHLPLALSRVRSTKSQGHLKTDERAKNVHKAFSVSPKYTDRLKGASVVLIDDVYTTGATVKECAETLKQSGVKEVNVLTLARVLKT